MGYIHCCGGLRSTRTSFIKPKDGFVLCRMDVLNECPVCGSFIVQITRRGCDDKISIVRKSNQRAIKLYTKLEKLILYDEERFYPNPKKESYKDLNYSEFGKIKPCSSNFSTLKIGLQENKEFLLTPKIVLR